MIFLLLIVPVSVVLWALVFVSFRATREPTFLGDVRPAKRNGAPPGAGHHPAGLLRWSASDDRQLARLLDGAED